MEDSKIIIFCFLSRMLLMQKSRGKFNLSIHANDNDTKRDKLKLCLRMLMLQGNFSSGIYSESYNFYQKILFSKNLFFRCYIKRSNFLINPINTRLIVQLHYCNNDLNNNATNKPAYALSRNSA